MRNDLLDPEIAFLRISQKMREEMDRVWKDFFENNPEKKVEGVWQWVEKRLRNQQNLNGEFEILVK